MREDLHVESKIGLRVAVRKRSVYKKERLVQRLRNGDKFREAKVIICHQRFSVQIDSVA